MPYPIYLSPEGSLNKVSRYSCHPLTLYATPYFSYMPEWRRKSKSPELATLGNDRVQNLQPPKNETVYNLPPLSFGLCHFLGVASSLLCHFRGWPVQDSCFFLYSGTEGNYGVARIPGHPVGSINSEFAVLHGKNLASKRPMNLLTFANSSTNINNNKIN